jgi:DNA-binding transcriptional MerR regulator
MSDNGQISYKVTEAARLTGVSASTLRAWELQGLIEPNRTSTGQRTFSSAHLKTLQRIQWLRTEQGLNPAAIKNTLAKEKPAKPITTREESDNIGKRSRHIRQSAGRTLADVAGQAGVAISALSTFERTSQGLSMKALHELADALGTTVSALSGTQDDSSRQLIRNGEWQSWPQTIPGVTVQLMAEGRNQMDCHRFVLSRGASSEGAYDHEGHVLQGSLEIVLGSRDFHNLNQGDSLYFKSSIHHSWKNSFDGETVLLWVNTPPTF